MLETRPATVVYVATSIEGFIARPDGAIDWLGEPENGEDFGWVEFIGTIDRIVMGRKTFEQVVSFDSWPYEGTPVTVLSATLDSLPEDLRGKAELSSLDPEALLEQLAKQGCSKVYVDGGKTIQTFLHADLIDELIITTIPILIGAGISLFGSLDKDLTWEHQHTKVFKAGLVQTGYRRIR